MKILFLCFILTILGGFLLLSVNNLNSPPPFLSRNRDSKTKKSVDNTLSNVLHAINSHRKMKSYRRDSQLITYFGNYKAVMYLANFGYVGGSSCNLP